ncbi:MAG: leucine-rich repeat domain-containing protein [Clostridia bacterium]|nr:leucine-rich repeat domain-containing protein [Clostridia bacterium]
MIHKKTHIIAITLAAVLALMLLMSVGHASRAGKTDASGQWKYVHVGDNAVIMGYVEKPQGALVIPGEVDGYTVTSIFEEAFSACNDLTSVTIPDGVTKIGDFAFAWSSSLTSITIPDSVKSLGNGVFAGCDKLTGVIIPNSVTSIGDSAFSNCTSLTSITIPDSVTTIGSGAFAQCEKLTSITIPSSVTKIGSNPFMACPFTFIDVCPDNPVYEDIDGVLFDKQQKILVSYPGAREGVYTIPEGTRLIGDFAFSECLRITEVTIPNSVTGIGVWGFDWCRRLTHVLIPESVTSIGWNAFNGCIRLTLSVQKGSVTEQYAQDNDIPYVYIIAN